MTRIVYWNVQQFSENKIHNTSAHVSTGQGGLSNAAASAVRYNLLRRHVTTLNPEILIIVEVSSGSQGNGRLATPSLGRSGCLWLAAQLRALPGPGGVGVQDDWRLVPPLQVGIGGVTESVAVFYRGRIFDGGGAAIGHRYFSGPNVWSGGPGGISAEPGAAAPANYPVNIRAFLQSAGGATRQVPGGALDNGGLNEDQLAARVHFRSTLPAALGGGPGGFMGFVNFRPPYMCTFTETDNAGNITKNLSVFAIHSPPRPPGSGWLMANLPLMFDINRPLRVAEARVICGDFNLNLLAPGGGNATPYALLQAIGYTPQLNAPAVVPPGVPLGHYRGYFATHIKPRKKSVLWSTAGTQPPYPGYGYIGSSRVSNFFSIDNILTLGGAPAGFTIFNTVTGSPLNAMAVPPGVNPGNAVFAHDFQNPPAAGWPTIPNAPATAAGLASSLRGWANYGHIYSTSDHFALGVIV